MTRSSADPKSRFSFSRQTLRILNYKSDEYENNYLMQFYREMCNAGIFTNPASTWEANDKFTLFIVPCMMRAYDFYYGDSYSPYGFMEEIMLRGYENIIEKLTNVGAKISLEEI